MEQIGEFVKMHAAKILVTMFTLMAITGACSYLNKKAGLEDDHLAEEIVEDILKHHTGVDIDLSFESAED